MDDDIKGAAVKFPPPLIYLIFMLVAYAAHYFYPVALKIPSGLNYIGVAVALLGIYIVMLVRRSFKRAETHIEPWKPTTTIISTGIYTYSRNPIYIGFCFVPIGMGIFLNSFWILIAFIPAAILVYYVAISKEETYLEEKFGAEYIHYKSEVRRWL